MTKIKSIYVEHTDSPNISCHLDLNAWNIDRFDNIDKLVKSVTEEIKEIWMDVNRQSVAAATMPRSEMIKYFWSKRPTSITITFDNGTKSVYVIDYPKDVNTFPNIRNEKQTGYADVGYKQDYVRY